MKWFGKSYGRLTHISREGQGHRRCLYNSICTARIAPWTSATNAIIPRDNSGTLNGAIVSVVEKERVLKRSRNSLPQLGKSTPPRHHARAQRSRHNLIESRLIVETLSRGLLTLQPLHSSPSTSPLSPKDQATSVSQVEPKVNTKFDKGASVNIHSQLSCRAVTSHPPVAKSILVPTEDTFQLRGIREAPLRVKLRDYGTWSRT